MRVLLVLLGIALYGMLPGRAAAFLRSVTYIPESKTNGRLVVVLEKKATLRLYYDNEKPLNPDSLSSFWFDMQSSGKAVRHVFKLGELWPNRVYYFRLEQRLPVGRRSSLFTWNTGVGQATKIPATGKNND